MLHFASQLSNQRRMRQLFKRARLNRATSSASIGAAPSVHTPQHSGDDGMSMSDTMHMLSTPASDLTASLRKELVDTGRHFSKVASRFVFDNNAASYNAWVIQFKAETENCGLESTLTDPRNDTALTAMRQKTAYHMILSCVPKAVLASVTSSLPPGEHTAYEAWRTLRRYYIGDEATYLQGLETRFNRATWHDDEDFPAFEIRFNQLVAELEAGGQSKTDHVKKSVFLHAIESSNKKDTHGVHVFNRLNTTSQIHYLASFTEWMVYMRVEAQHIHDSIMAHRGVKRARENLAADAPHIDATPISFVAPSAAAAASPQGAPPRRPSPFHAQRTRNAPCHFFQQGKSCRFGAQCKFSHDAPTNRHGPSQSKANEACIKFSQGHCFRGDKCPYVHSEPMKEESSTPQHLLRHVTFNNTEN
jgi:hypothetical protein